MPGRTCPNFLSTFTLEQAGPDGWRLTMTLVQTAPAATPAEKACTEVASVPGRQGPIVLESTSAARSTLFACGKVRFTP